MFIHWGPVSLTEQEISWSRANTNPKCPNNGPIPVKSTTACTSGSTPSNSTPAVGGHRQVGRNEIHGAHRQALRRILALGLQGDDYNIMHTPWRATSAASWPTPPTRQGCASGGITRRWIGRTPIAATRKTPHSSSECKRRFGILTNYGRIDVLWFDSDGKEAVWDQEATYAMVKKLQPNIVINNRLDLGRPTRGRGRG